MVKLSGVEIIFFLIQNALDRALTIDRDYQIIM